MDIAELRNKLNNIAAELAEQDVQQEDIAIEEEQVEEVEQPVAEEEFAEEDNLEEADYTLDPETNKYTLVSKPKQPQGDMRSRARSEKGILKSIQDRDKEAKDSIKNALSSLIPDEVKRQTKAAFGEADEVEETVEVPVAALAELMQLAGYANYADKLQEYENEPEEEYSDTEDQLIGLSGGLNGPKKAYAAAAGGDNPMNQEPTEIEEDAIANVEESLYKSYKAFLEEAEINEEEE